MIAWVLNCLFKVIVESENLLSFAMGLFSTSKRGSKKGRKLEFAIVVHVHSLNNFPLGSDGVFFKLKQPDGSQKPHWSQTYFFSNNAVSFEESVPLMASMTVDSATNVIQSHVLRLSIRQLTTKSFQRLGVVLVDLAELANQRETTRRYLLENSRYNASLLLSIKTQQTQGDPQFICPATTQTPFTFRADSVDDIQFGDPESPGVDGSSYVSQMLAGMDQSVNTQQIEEAKGIVDDILGHTDDELDGDGDGDTG